MSDLIINNNGDLDVIETSGRAIDEGRVVKALYDLNTTDNYISDLIIKAVQTPRGNITIVVPNLDTADIVDSSYGSSIYRELSEGITLNFLSRVKSHIIDTLQTANLLVRVLDIQVGMVDPYTIQLNITYGDNTPNTFIRVSVQ